MIDLRVPTSYTQPSETEEEEEDAADTPTKPGDNPARWRLRAVGDRFVDGEGRTVQLHGVNLATKVPSKPAPMPTHLEQQVAMDGTTWDFFDGRSVSYVGRPFPLEEADEHLSRLRGWGFNCLRFNVTWEALEHAGPGQYDHEYIRYVRAVLERAAVHGFWIYIDPHQDCWSRFTGGSGHPSWTMEMVGMDVRKLVTCGAAVLHQTWPGDKSRFTRMLWPTNAFKYAAGTMFSLFWGGDKYAPGFTIKGEPAQQFLQRHYIDALATLAAALRGLPNILGFGSMNEPVPGFLGVKHLNQLYGPLRNGNMTTAFEGMALASGVTTNVRFFSATSLKCLITGRPLRHTTLNPNGESIWLVGCACPWQQAGVWSAAPGGGATLHKPDYFRAADFGAAHYLPFARRYAAAIRAALGAEQLCFVELPPMDLKLCTFPTIKKAPLDEEGADAADAAATVVVAEEVEALPSSGRAGETIEVAVTSSTGRATLTAAASVVLTERAASGGAAAGQTAGEAADERALSGGINAVHWYDNLTLYLGRYFANVSFDVQSGVPALGRNHVFNMLCRQLRELKHIGAHEMCGVPTLIGECGIPFDMHGYRAYKTGDYAQPLRAMDATVSAMEENLLHYTLWCYTADHCAKWGDNWNLEDLSIFSPELHNVPGDPYSGGRALHAVARPYATHVAGLPHTSRFHMATGRYGLGFTTAAAAAAAAAAATGEEGPSSSSSSGETLIFVPMLHYPSGFDVFVSDGEVVELRSSPRLRCRHLVYRHSPAATAHDLLIVPRVEGSELPPPASDTRAAAASIAAGTAPATRGGPPVRTRTRTRTVSMVESVVEHLPFRQHRMAYEYPSRSDASTELQLRKALPRSPQCRALNALQRRLLRRSPSPACSAAPLDGERYSSERADS